MNVFKQPSMKSFAYDQVSKIRMTMAKWRQVPTLLFKGSRLSLDTLVLSPSRAQGSGGRFRNKASWSCAASLFRCALLWVQLLRCMFVFQLCFHVYFPSSLHFLFKCCVTSFTHPQMMHLFCSSSRWQCVYYSNTGLGPVPVLMCQCSGLGEGSLKSWEPDCTIFFLAPCGMCCCSNAPESGRFEIRNMENRQQPLLMKF